MNEEYVSAHPDDDVNVMDEVAKELLKQDSFLARAKSFFRSMWCKIKWTCYLKSKLGKEDVKASRRRLYTIKKATGQTSELLIGECSRDGKSSVDGQSQDAIMLRVQLNTLKWVLQMVDGLPSQEKFAKECRDDAKHANIAPIVEKTITPDGKTVGIARCDK